jgi:GNAT superfamily N-acetyltransferase
MALTTVEMNHALPAHLRAAAEVLCSTSLTWRPTEAELEKEFASTPEHVEEIRFLVFDDDIPVGYCRVGTYRYVVDARRLLVTVRVIPSYRRRGIGASMIETMRPWVSNRVVHQIWASTEIDDSGQPTSPAGDAFAKKYGMEKRESRFESVLDTSHVDPGVVAHAVEACARQGIVITSIETLLTDPVWQGRDWQRELYEVDCAAMADEPTEQSGEPNPFEEWTQEFLTGHETAGMIVAVHESVVVGLSLHWQEASTVLVASTGTLKAFRSMGVARAMKLAGAAYGQAKTMPLRAFNQDGNPHIVNLNRSLGFVRRSGHEYWRLNA